MAGPLHNGQTPATSTPKHWSNVSGWWMVLSRHGRSDASLRTYMGWNENKIDVRVVVEKHCNYNCGWSRQWQLWSEFRDVRCRCPLESDSSKSPLHRRLLNRIHLRSQG